MIKVKELIIKPIEKKIADNFVKKYHYSNKIVNNSSLHFGVFSGSILGGVLQFGPPMDKSKVINLVRETPWHSMLELNRMAFSDLLPKNSESRSIAICMRLIKKNYPQIQWILSFSDATQCGDGTIYRASGFKLIGIRKNKTIMQTPSGKIFVKLTLTANSQSNVSKSILKDLNIENKGSANIKNVQLAGAKNLDGFQLKYIYFLDKEALNRLTVPIIPFSKITAMQANMYKGKKIASKASDGLHSSNHSEGVAPILTLQSKVKETNL
jgi:hypothetical protein